MKIKHLKKFALFMLVLLILVAYFLGVTYFFFMINRYFFLLIVFSAYVLNLIIIILLLNQKRQTYAKFSWTAIMLILPIIGHILFLTYGLTYSNKKEAKINKDSKYDLTNYCHWGKNPKKAIQQLEKMNHTIALSGEFEFYNEGWTYFDELKKDLKKANSSINIISYIIKKSEIFDEILYIIEEKLKEGVEIKWLIDYFGSGTVRDKVFKKLSKKYKNFEYEYIGKILYPFINSKSFYRNHQKFIIIDNKVVYSGGNNISDEYSSYSKKYGHWIDFSYKFSGDYVNVYIVHFAKFWKMVTNKEIELNLEFNNNQNEPKTTALLIYDTPLIKYSNAENTWIKLFAAAKKKIQISTPYFSVTDSLKKQIISALYSGVEVEIFLPGFPDKKMVYQVSLNEVSELINFGLKVYIYNDHFLHSKVGLVDDKIAWFGTSNMDARSMFAQYETTDLIEGESVKEIKKVFDNYKEKCVEFTNFKKYNSNKNIIKKLFYKLLKPLI